GFHPFRGHGPGSAGPELSLRLRQHHRKDRRSGLKLGLLCRKCGAAYISWVKVMKSLLQFFLLVAFALSLYAIPAVITHASANPVVSGAQLPAPAAPIPPEL